MKKVIFLLAVSFSLVFAYTAADVYGAWNISGKLTGEKMFIKRLADGIYLINIEPLLKSTYVM
jgi:hypothetical protein